MRQFCNGFSHLSAIYNFYLKGYFFAMEFIKQNEMSECGLACLVMIGSFYKASFDLRDLRTRFPMSARGLPLVRLIEIATELSLSPRAIRLEPVSFKKLKLPCVLHWNFNHYVVLTKVTSKRCELLDPAIGKRSISWQEINDCFTGIAVEFSPTLRMKQASKKEKLSLIDMFGLVYVKKSTVVSLFCVAFVFELFIVILPVCFQLIFDRALGTLDEQLLSILIGVAAFFSLMQFVSSILRSKLIGGITYSINVTWGLIMYDSVLNMPYDWHIKRSKGELISKFYSMRSVQEAITIEALTTLLEGGTAIFVGIALAIFNAHAFFVSLLGMLLFLTYKALISESLKRSYTDLARCQGLQQFNLIESVTGAVSLKLADKTSYQLIRYIKLLSETGEIEESIHNGKYFSQSFLQLILVLCKLGIILFGFYLVEGSGVTVGAIIASLFYSDILIIKAAKAVDKYFDLQMVGRHLENIEDVFSNHTETVASFPERYDISNFDLCVSNVGYRYAEHEPWVFSGVTFTVKDGECVAIIGPSGCGKSTLVNIVLGLLAPTVGDVFLNGKTIKSIGLKNYQKLIATVLQDDVLFSGSIFENISFFDPDASFGDVHEAALLADIHSTVEGMAMGYHTRINDGGTGISGGQRQRLLLARALYRRPKILILDESTSNLDVELEKSVSKKIGSLSMTRIIIAHRPETIKSADRVIDMRSFFL